MNQEQFEIMSITVEGMNSKKKGRGDERQLCALQNLLDNKPALMTYSI